MGCLMLLASQFNMHHPHQTVSMACCAASSAAFCSSASRSVSYYQAAWIREGLTSNHSQKNSHNSTSETKKFHPSPAIFGPFFLSRWWCRKRFPAINAKLVRILVEYFDIPIAITSQSPKWSSDLREGGRVIASNIEVKTPTYITHAGCSVCYYDLISKAFSSICCLQNHISENSGLGVAYLFKKIEVGFRKPDLRDLPTQHPILAPFLRGRFLSHAWKGCGSRKTATDQGDKVTKVQSANRCNYFGHWISVHLTKTKKFCLKIKGCWVLNFGLASFHQSKVSEVFLFCLSEFLFLASWTSSKWFLID